MKDFQTFRKEIQIFRKEIQAGPEGTKFNPSISFAESSLMKGLRRPPHGLFCFWAASGLKGAAESVRRCLFALGSLSVLLSSFRVLRSSRASEGLAPFWSRICVFVRRMDAICPTRRAASLKGENQGTSVHESPSHNPRVMSPGTGTEDAVKTGQSIGCPARMRPLKEPEPVSSLWISGRAPALHACECLTTLSSNLIPSVSPCEAGSGRFRRAR
jgi:hypothetical protein